MPFESSLGASKFLIQKQLKEPGQVTVKLHLKQGIQSRNS